jgi:hypothetical protein
LVIAAHQLLITNYPITNNYQPPVNLINWLRSDDQERREATLLFVAALFIFNGGLTLSLARQGEIVWRHLWAPLVWLALMLAAHLILRYSRLSRDPFLLPIIGLLTGWGALLIDRLAANFLARQMVWLGLATAVMLAIALIPRNLRFLRRYRYTWLVGGLLLLAATLLFGVNPSGFGATLWLKLPFVGQIFFQPSELLKLLLVVFLASYFDERQKLLKLDGQRGWLATAPYLAPLLVMWGFCLALLVWQRDLGAAALFFILFLALLYLATGDGRYLLGGLAMLLLAGHLRLLRLRRGRPAGGRLAQPLAGSGQPGLPDCPIAARPGGGRVDGNGPRPGFPQLYSRRPF